jgi:hypothetical protein
MKPGKKEKIRYGQAPRETLPDAGTAAKTEDAGALPETASADEPANPLEAAPEKPDVKTRFSSRARVKKPKVKQQGAQTDVLAPAPADSTEVADRDAGRAAGPRRRHLQEEEEKEDGDDHRRQNPHGRPEEAGPGTEPG